MKKGVVSYRSNLRVARSLWGELSSITAGSLCELTAKFSLSVAAGDFQLLNGRWFITLSGLLRLASRRGCCGIKTSLQQKVSDPALGRWVFKATVYKSGRSKGFVAHGDADPTNVGPLVRGAELRVAESRAIARGLRQALGIGLCSVEELGTLSGSPTPANNHAQPIKPQPQNGSNNGQPRLRDKLCLLIRQYDLDANLVKAYAADFCGTETLRGASRELVESFIPHLSTAAKENRDALVCKLNSYAQPVEAKP